MNYIALPGLKYRTVPSKKLGVDQLSYILASTCEGLGVSISDVKGKVRRAEFVEARQIYCLLAKKYTHASLKSIGSLLNRDHTTVIHSVNTIKDLLSYDTGLNDAVVMIENRL